MKLLIKRIGWTAISLLLVLFLLCYPEDALCAARSGMNLWLNVILPTLLPFLILTGILIHVDLTGTLLRPLEKIWNLLLGISVNGAYALLIGILCGYPMGAKVTSDLYESQKIDKTEAEYLLTFVNHPSPVFLRTYMCHICLKDQVDFVQVWLLLLLANLPVLLFFRFIVFKNNTCTAAAHKTVKKKTSISSSTGAFLDVSIMNGFETITRLGGYILMFSILSSCICRFWKSEQIPGYIISGIMEITTGLYQLQSANLQFMTKYMLAVFLTAFGGICITFQTRSVITKRLSLIPYVIAKLLTGSIAVLLVLFFVKIV
ncbi:hypothetical protein [Blautia sp. MSJ-19]|uniref:hypothetical protein n=1 Tax=Blautia sp. MSJ-19 TaxID=2841517 RepID=UPI001C0EA3A1|nr:hypothetical protein [Blautia sp. MSJ-19]MBU5481955.1 hypothetical protein [Blautia sp. MSJ-19]